MEFEINISPKMITIITTYKCTAACEDCCFECTPKLNSTLNYEEISNAIISAHKKFPRLELVVFTGGECFILKQNLFKAISLCTNLGLKTRCVTNAYWAKTYSSALKVSESLKLAGISEINISTGLDHQKWVPQESIVNASRALLSKSIFTLVTIEKDSASSNCYKDFVNEGNIKHLISNKPETFRVQSNVWMPFHSTSEKRDCNSLEHLKKGCDQIFNNCVITPKKEISACCGLTLEHIPEMKLGSISNVDAYVQAQKDDFLKLWLRTEGPFVILQKILGSNHPDIADIQHQCQACAVLHQNSSVKEKLIDNYHKNIIPVFNKFKMLEVDNQI